MSRWRALEPLARHAEHAIVFAQRRDVAGRHALELEAQNVERVGPLDRLLDAVEHRDAELVDRVRQQRARTAHRHLGAHLRAVPRCSSARRASAARRRTMQTLMPSSSPKWSRSVSMSSSPCVGCSCVPSPALMTFDSMRSARNCAAPDAPWRITTMSIRIASRLRAVSTSVSPLRHARARRRDVHRVGREALLGELERDARARRRLEEQVDDRRAAQRRHLLDRPLADLLERLGGVENQTNLLAATAARARADPCRARASRRASLACRR